MYLIDGQHGDQKEIEYINRCYEVKLQVPHTAQGFLNVWEISAQPGLRDQEDFRHEVTLTLSEARKRV